MQDILIRRAESPADYRACQEAQGLAWGIRDASYLVPVATMVGAQHHGGLVLGAFLPGGRAVGVSFAFLGKVDGRYCLYSQLTGVVPGYQAIGLGRRLKYAQRDFCREQDLGLMAWAFDPCQQGNARFNLMKLGATVTRFLPNMYGPRTDDLNLGLPTDRLIAEWGIDDQPRPPISDADVHQVERVVVFGADLLPSYRLPEAPCVLLEIPQGIVSLRAENPNLLSAWRSVVAEAFTSCFEQGYRATGFVQIHENEGERSRAFYRMETGT